MADAVTQLLLAAKTTAEQARALARLEGDPRGTEEATTAIVSLADAMDARILTARRIAA